MANENGGLILKNLQGYQENNNIGLPRGANPARVQAGNSYTSLVNKLHLIKLADNFPANETGYRNYSKFQPKTAFDLCKMGSSDTGAATYDIEDFIYCKHFGQPINKLITLRRFPLPCTDNIYDRTNQQEPDISRMVTYITQDTNKLEDLLSFSYGLRWKELNAEMEDARTEGDQSGFTGLSKKIMSFIDPVLAGNTLQGQNKLNYDPKHDQNKVYGPVDSITQTHIRDVGFDFTKEFDIVFDYDLQSWGGRSPEFALKDILANALATTYNNGKFWPGSRYWVGERPSQFLDKVRFMNPDNLDQFFSGGLKSLKGAISQFATKGSAIKQLKNAMSNGLAMAIGKLLDNIGRPSIIVMNSLLAAEPTGFWHLTIGNPYNPTMCIGNLLCTGVDVSFPTDSFGYGDFPTKIRFNVKLKPGQPKDGAGIEMMFNMGKSRIYYNPKSVKKESNNNIVSKQARSFYGYETAQIERTISDAFDFVADKVVVTTQNTYNAANNLLDNSKQNDSSNQPNLNLIDNNSAFRMFT